MKAFIIISNNSPSKNGMLISVISAFVSIESIGFADNLAEAVDIVRQRYPNSLIFDSRILEEKGHDYLVSLLESRGSFIMVPKIRQIKDKYIYIGIDFSVAEQKGWLLNEISQTLREYQLFAAE